MDPTKQEPMQNSGAGQSYPAGSQAYPAVQPVGLPRPDAIYADPAQLAAPTAQAAMSMPAPMPPQPTIPAAPQALPQALPQAYSPQPQQVPQMPAAANPGGIPPRPIATKTNQNSTQNALQIAEIRDGIVIMNDGSYRSVVMVKSINFDLMSSQEQESVEYAYQGFLNSLYFEIQIFVRSQRVDMQPYIDKLDKIRTEHDNMLLALLMDDYIDYIDQLSQQTNIMDKKFYVVIPFRPVTEVQKALTRDKNFFSGLIQLLGGHEEPRVIINEAELEKAKTELRNRVQAVLGGLQQCNIQGLPLDTQELIELYYDTYNPDTATRQQLKNFDSMATDVVTKGQGMATQAHLQRELQ